MTKKTWDTENDHYQRKTGIHIQMWLWARQQEWTWVTMKDKGTQKQDWKRAIVLSDRSKSFQWMLIKICRGVEWACANNPWKVALRPPMVHHGQLYLSVYLDILVENWQKACSDVTFTFHTCLSCKLHKKTKWKCTKYKTTPLESELRFVLSFVEAVWPTCTQSCYKSYFAASVLLFVSHRPAGVCVKIRSWQISLLCQNLPFNWIAAFIYVCHFFR